ncbi:MAG: hypothetical protein AAF438_14615, partial [Pseudomonadota bacterium]
GSMNSLESEVFCRFYGVLCGFSSRFMAAELGLTRYAALRGRCLELFDEIDLLVHLPASQRAFVEQRMGESLGDRLREKSVLLADFFELGSLTYRVLVSDRMGHDEEETQTIRDIGQAYGLPTAQLLMHLEAPWSDGLYDDQVIVELMGRGYDVAAFALVDTPREDDACFVVMPFDDHSLYVYRALHHDALRKAGLVPVRGWQTVSNEHYLHLLRMILGKCGTTLVDLTPADPSGIPNLNVVHEIGMSMAIGNTSLIVCRGDKVTLPSNFTGLPIYSMSLDEQDWPTPTELGELFLDMLTAVR